MKSLFWILSLLYLGANGYLFLRTWQHVSPTSIGGRLLLTLLFLSLSIALFVGFYAERAAWPMGLCRVLYLVGAIWLLVLLYMTLSLGVMDLVRLFRPDFRWGYPIAWLFTLVLLIGGHLCYLHPEVITVEISLKKPLEHPLRIVAVSDVHLGYGTGPRRLARYVELINRQQPDAVLIAGDLIDNSVRPVEAFEMEQLLGQIEAPAGIWMVPGNHEYISGLARCEEFLARTPIRLLRDETVELAGGLQLLGRDDRSNPRRASIDSLLRGADSSRPLLLLDHQPLDPGACDRPEVDIQCYGHTHRGQVWPLNWLTDGIFPQSHGHRKWQYSDVVVSCGLSLWGPPFRIGTRSDLILFCLK